MKADTSSHYPLAYMAVIWAFVFAALSAYWGSGGTVGLDTLGDGILEMALAGDSELMFINWISVVGKIIIGLLVLGLMHQRGAKRLRRLMLIGVWATGILLVLYGGANLVQHILMAVGNIPIAGLLGSQETVRWHIFLWDPWWLMGGILFLLTAWYFSKQPNQPD